ncbi:ROK family transcriptional regulator [Escherichia coli]|uniref:ROK family transcriptional regulator n=1 Tax=Escherichia coli TaxID=562 RepID=UPI0003EFA6E3|nr:ROK family transcriptional regulator [Escherichia coli]EEU9372018.1 ROK family transcriptional regulator [Escherichia coli]EEX0486868.1 ROK family transcriptional regulator [Escherichia coli]EFE7419214.1 ROK family transcriptional regulator [Escherichia coli]EFG2046365.1 ROK family transcriptional regulator [Escherichia coli]EFJ2439667.1 ROK family transcriptional regulator [Escherichia coli]
MNTRHERLELRGSQRLLLELIRRHAPVTRAELARLSNLTAGAITQQCRELIFAGLIVEGERNTGQRGQPSLPLRLNPGGGCAIGLSFSPGFIDMTVVDLSGRPLLTITEHHQENQPLETTLRQIKTLVEQTLKKRQLQHARILGIGYAVPGFLKADGRKRHSVPWLATWREMDLQQAFANNLPWPTWVENNANASAIGEMYSGEWNDYSDLTFIDLGYGIGAGIIAGHKLLRGGFSNAGEVGMAFPSGTPRPSYKDLLATLEHAGFAESDLPELINSHHELLETWFTRCCSQVEQTIFGCVQWVDPQLIVLGGIMPKPILNRLVEEIAPKLQITLDANRPHVSLGISSQGAHSASHGAAMIPLYQFINEE